MIQPSFDFPLSAFEEATVEQLVSFKIKKGKKESTRSVNKRIKIMINSDKLKAEAIKLVNKWNKKRIKLGLKTW